MKQDQAGAGGHQTKGQEEIMGGRRTPGLGEEEAGPTNRGAGTGSSGYLRIEFGYRPQPRQLQGPGFVRPIGALVEHSQPWVCPGLRESPGDPKKGKCYGSSLSNTHILKAPVE